jgi:hypothetical protein
MKQRILALILFFVITASLAWSPWITQERAFSLAETQFNDAWDGVIDGCGTAGINLGAKDFHKVPFGATVMLQYQCGLVMPGAPPLQTTVYVPFFGVAFGYPAP